MSQAVAQQNTQQQEVPEASNNSQSSLKAGADIDSVGGQMLKFTKNNEIQKYDLSQKIKKAVDNFQKIVTLYCKADEHNLIGNGKLLILSDIRDGYLYLKNGQNDYAKRKDSRGNVVGYVFLARPFYVSKEMLTNFHTQVNRIINFINFKPDKVKAAAPVLISERARSFINLVAGNLQHSNNENLQYAYEAFTYYLPSGLFDVTQTSYQEAVKLTESSSYQSLLYLYLNIKKLNFGSLGGFDDELINAIGAQEFFTNLYQTTTQKFNNLLNDSGLQNFVNEINDIVQAYRANLQAVRKNSQQFKNEQYTKVSGIAERSGVQASVIRNVVNHGLAIPAYDQNLGAYVAHRSWTIMSLSSIFGKDIPKGQTAQTSEIVAQFVNDSSQIKQQELELRKAVKNNEEEAEKLATRSEHQAKFQAIQGLDNVYNQIDQSDYSQAAKVYELIRLGSVACKIAHSLSEVYATGFTPSQKKSKSGTKSPTRQQQQPQAAVATQQQYQQPQAQQYQQPPQAVAQQPQAQQFVPEEEEEFGGQQEIYSPSQNLGSPQRIPPQYE